MKTLTKFANAKINLGLQVLNKRSDGFHNINTFFVPISLADKITITESDAYSLECNVDFNIPDEKNLAIIAAKLLNHYCDSNQKVKVIIDKQIPHGAGLGGGSSDAAAVLCGMNELFSFGLCQEELATIGLQIGSDVPFFIYNEPAIATGRGEQFQFHKFSPDCSLLLVFPNINIATGLAYKALARTNEEMEITEFYKYIKENKISDYHKYIYNDFEGFAIENHSEIGEIKNKLVQNGSIFALMSGSGSSIFGLFDSDESAIAAASDFKQYRTFVCNFLKV